MQYLFRFPGGIDTSNLIKKIKQTTKKVKKMANKAKTSEFSLKMDNPRILKAIIETLASIIDEVEFLITPKAFIAKAMDPSRICLLQLILKKEVFDAYQCSGKFKICLNLDDFDKILKRANTNDVITISFIERDQKIKIQMKPENAKRTKTFSLTLLYIDIDEIPMDNLLGIEYDAKWKMDPDFLTEAIKDAEIYSEILNIKSEEGKGLILSSSGQIGEMTYELEEEELLESNIESDEIGAYSLTFLKNIMKIASITENLEISLKSDHPFKMFFDLLEGGELFYFLAPRVDQGENDFGEYDDEDEETPNEAPTEEEITEDTN